MSDFQIVTSIYISETLAIFKKVINMYSWWLQSDLFTSFSLLWSQEIFVLPSPYAYTLQSLFSTWSVIKTSWNWHNKTPTAVSWLSTPWLKGEWNYSTEVCVCAEQSVEMWYRVLAKCGPGANRTSTC